MERINVRQVEGTEFPAGRRTRVVVGPGAPLEAQNFVMGHVTIYPGGSVPLHVHEQEEVYYIAGGNGEMMVDEEKLPVGAGDFIYIRPHRSHQLTNTGTTEMVMMFCYAPKKIAEHWAEELKGGEHK